MKKIILIFCIAVCFVVALRGESEPASALRLRVVANSDTPLDQQEKIQVVSKMSSVFEDCSFESVNEAETWISENISKIESALSDVDAKIELCDEYYEAEYKNGIYYPEGQYRSLVVRLGEGSGHNFWGTLFPEIALGVSSASKSKNKPLFTFVKDGGIVEARLFIVDCFLKNFK